MVMAGVLGQHKLAAPVCAPGCKNREKHMCHAKCCTQSHSLKLKGFLTVKHLGKLLSTPVQFNTGNLTFVVSITGARIISDAATEDHRMPNVLSFVPEILSHSCLILHIQKFDSLQCITFLNCHAC